MIGEKSVLLKCSEVERDVECANTLIAGKLGIRVGRQERDGHHWLLWARVESVYLPVLAVVLVIVALHSLILEKKRISSIRKNRVKLHRNLPE